MTVMETEITLTINQLMEIIKVMPDGIMLELSWEDVSEESE